MTHGAGLFVGAWLSGRVAEMNTVGGVHDWTAIRLVPAVGAAGILAVFALLFKPAATVAPDQPSRRKLKLPPVRVGTSDSPRSR